jgi:uncharacterized protein YraI
MEATEVAGRWIEAMDIKRNFKLILAAVTVGGVLAGSAMAEGRNVLSANDVSMRAGPGASFRKVTTVAKNQIVTVHGCARAYSWCDVDWAGYRGWVSAKFLRLPRMTGGLASIAADLGIPVVDYAAADYEARHYVVHAEPAGVQLIERQPADADVRQGPNYGRAAQDAAFLTDGPLPLPADNRDLLGGEIPK